MVLHGSFCQPESVESIAVIGLEILLYHSSEVVHMTRIDGDGSSTTSTAASLLLQQVFNLADDAYGDGHKLVNDDDNDNALLRKLLRGYFKKDAGHLNSSSMIQSSCTQVWDTLGRKENRSLDGWANMVVTSLFLLTAKGCGEELMVQIWRLVAHPAEERYSGLGRFIMRRAAAAAAAAEEEEKYPRSRSRLALMSFAVATLRGGGHPPPPPPPTPSAQQQPSSSRSRGGDGGEEAGGEGLLPPPSHCGLRLALDVASHSLEACLQEQEDKGEAAAPAASNEGEISATALEAWRWNIHQEVCVLQYTCCCSFQ